MWLFDRPKVVLTASDAAQLSLLLQRLDEATDDGSYVAGFLAYEAGYALEPASGTCPRGTGDLAWFGVYDAPEEVGEGALSALQDGAMFSVSDPRFAYDRATYAELFHRVRHHIFEGDVYQINLSGPLDFDLGGSVLGLYGALVRAQQGGYGAYVNTGDYCVLSRSPELFFLRAGKRIRTRPMKGTSPRGTNSKEDETNAHVLRADPKSRAENLMIVDLLRNDLSVVCEPGTVDVPALFRTETHESLIQMTSTVEGRLRPDTSLADLFRALFPCGSVTGAPKIRAMRLIRDLEPGPRGIYCGSIGWAGPLERAVFNVAIRTAVVDGDRARMGLGSGLVWDSDLDAEYEECLLKGQFLLEAARLSATPRHEDLQLIETMRWDGRGIALLRYHLARLAASAEALGFIFDEDVVRQVLHEETQRLPPRVHRVRMLVSRGGGVEVVATPLDVTEERPVGLALARARMASEDPLRRHKTTRRAAYEALYRAGRSSGADEVLMLNERAEVCEGTRSNVLIRRGGVFWTPPVSSGLVPGAYRAYLLDTRDDVHERVMFLSDLLEAEQLFVCNAVQGMRAASLVAEPEGGIRVVAATEDESVMDEPEEQPQAAPQRQHKHMPSAL